MKKLIKILLIIAVILAVIYLAFFIINKINEGVMFDYIDTFETVGSERGLTPTYDKAGVAYFEADDEFKVMQLTDVHLGGGIFSQGKDKKVINAIEAMVREERPDFIVVTGDISFAVPFISGTFNNAYAHNMFIRLMERLGVYWTVTLGNHDSEAYNYHNREAVGYMYDNEELEYCLFGAVDGVSGVGNHVIHVKNQAGFIFKSLYMIDSHSYTDSDPLGLKWDYDYVKEDQIEWYRSSVEQTKEYNRELYNTLTEELQQTYVDYLNPKSLMFMHIPPREMKYAYDEYIEAGRSDTGAVEFVEGVDGEREEVVYSSRTDEELFETVLELGSTEAIFFGHDHLNNFVLKYNGVILSYGFSMDYLAYSGIDGKGAQRGCTVITCYPADSAIVHENYYQDKYQPIYEKESVDMSYGG